MSNFADQNDNYKYTLNVIDTFSKYAWSAWSRPLEKKNGIKVFRAFEGIIIDTIKIRHKLKFLTLCSQNIKLNYIILKTRKRSSVQSTYRTIEWMYQKMDRYKS